MTKMFICCKNIVFLYYMEHPLGVLKITIFGQILSKIDQNVNFEFLSVLFWQKSFNFFGIFRTHFRMILYVG